MIISENHMNYDVAVIGGGPAGMMAAGRAGELGKKVILLEKNHKLGIKLLTTGGGRANITNLKSQKELAAGFGVNGRWLLSGLSRFGSEELVAFFNSRGLKTKVEPGDRVFPVSNVAADVLQVLIDYLQQGKVVVKFDAEVKSLVLKGDSIQKIILISGEQIIAKQIIICTGGKTYPLTGSTGTGYAWLKKLGHHIISPRPALAPVLLQEKFVKDLEGLSLSEVGLTAYQEKKKIVSTVGPLLFTAQGVSGPMILNLSHQLERSFRLVIDFLPEIEKTELDKKLQQEFGVSQKMLKNAVAQLVPPKLAATIIFLSQINPSKKLNIINRAERLKLVSLLKELSVTVTGVAGFDKAMVTAGGVDLKEVDPKTMQSKIVANLYLAGEVLDLNGQTGGYNLQLCWTSGYLAGEASAR